MKCFLFTQLVVVIVLLNVDLHAQDLPYLFKENGEEKIDREKYGEYIQNHPYNNRKHISKAEMKAMDKQDRPDLAWEQEFLRTADPLTGRPMSERLWPILRTMHAKSANVSAAPGSSPTNKWTERGPNNVGGRTRALLFDPNDASKKKVWAGGVTGGLWCNNDITSSTSSWVAVNDFWANIAITCIAFDPVANNTMYVGTGEGWGGGGTSSRGAGIWKTTNGGTSWTQLAGTADFYYVNDIVVRNESGTGVVYAGVTRASYKGTFHGTKEGLYRSTNGGTSWTQVMPATSSGVYAAADIEIAKDNRIWVGSRTNAFGRGGGAVLFSDNGTTWTATTVVTSGERVELACAPSDSSVVYGIVEKSNKVEEIIRTTNRGTTWLLSSSSSSLTEPSDVDNGIPNTDFTRGQAFYDLIAAVSPGNKDTVVVGGIDLFMSTNGGTTWKQISKWSNNNNLRNLTCSRVHADQHQLVFRPGKSNEMIVGNDGGVYYCSNLKTAETNNNFSARNSGYNVTQFYAGAIHSTAGSNSMLAGSQDNGTQRFSSAGMNATTEATGGDGAFCHIDQSNPTHQTTSYVRNSIYRSTNSGFSWTRFINDLNTGSFINPSDYDDKHNILYTNKSSSSLYRFSNFTGASVTNTTITITGSTNSFTAITASPYSGSTSTLFLGNSGGQLFKVTNASTTPIVSNINASNTVPASSISCIEVGASENELLVTLFNYGRVSVYYTSNGGTTWVSKEGNLPDMPIRWALFNPRNRKEVIVATELGVWATSDISVSSPVWVASNNGLANVRVDMLQYRASDSLIMASTHGRGVFTGRFKAPVVTPGGLPVAKFGANKLSICSGESITFSDSSTNGPNTLIWTFTGGSPSTSSASNPSVSYATPGTYAVKLKATNANGTDSLTKTAYITVSAAPTSALSNFQNKCSNEPQFALSGGTPSGGTYSVNGVAATTFNPSSSGSGTYTIKYKVQANGCADSATQNLTVLSAPNVSAGIAPIVCENSPTFALSNGNPAGGVYTGNGVSNGMFNPVTAGAGSSNIKYKMTGPNGCADSAQFALVVNAKPNVVLAAAGPFCSGGTPITLNNGTPAGGNYSGPGISAGSFDPSTAGIGTHNVKYVFTNRSNCSDSATTTIRVDSGAVASLSILSDVCMNAAPFALTGGSPIGGTYAGPGVTNGMFDPSVAGAATHTISYTASSSCGTSTATQSINVDSIPNLTVSDSIRGCEGESVQFNATGANGYSWSPTTGLLNPLVGNPLLVLSSNITYTVTGAHQNGCSVEKTVRVIVSKVPAVQANPDMNICIGDTFKLLASGALNYSWLPNAGLNNSSIANPEGVGTASVVYVVTGTNSDNCSAKDTVSIDVKPPSNVTHAPISDLCVSSDPISLVGGTPSNGTYRGTGVVGNNFDPKISGLGTFTLRYSANEPNKCKATTSVNITVLQSPTIVWNMPTVICENGGVTILTSTPSGGTYSGTGVTGTLFDPGVAGIGFHELSYDVTASGCLATERREVEVVPGSDVDSITGLSNVVNNGKYNYQVNPINGAKYTWDITGGSLISSANNISTVKWGTGNSGKVVLIQTNSFGCSDTTELSININALAVGEEVEIGGGIVLFPNPADQSVKLKINAKNADDAVIRLFNNSGQIVIDNSSITQTNNEFLLPTAELPAGLYLLNAQLNGKTYNATLVVSH